MWDRAQAYTNRRNEYLLREELLILFLVTASTIYFNFTQLLGRYSVVVYESINWNQRVTLSQRLRG